jgi:hypothetical protein
VPITDVIALVAPTTPPMIGEKGLYTPGNVLVQPGCTWAEACEGAQASATSGPPSNIPNSFFRATRLPAACGTSTAARAVSRLMDESPTICMPE